MGLHILSFWISWLITYLCLITIVASIVILIQWKTAMFIRTSFSLLYLLYLLYGFSIITFASVMTTFFDKPKTASLVKSKYPHIRIPCNSIINNRHNQWFHIFLITNASICYQI